VDGNKEMMAIGLMNIAGSCSSCYVTTGNDSSQPVVKEIKVFQEKYQF